MRRKYDNETLEKVFYYYSLSENRMLTAAQAADCLNLSESSLFRVIADFRESISKEKEEELLQKYQNIDIHSVLNIKENPKNYSSEKSILEDIAITLAEILASVNELKQYIIEKNNTKVYQEKSFLKEETEKNDVSWEKLEQLEEFITSEENEVNTNDKEQLEIKEEQQETTWTEEKEPTVADLERELAKLEEDEEKEEIEENDEISNTIDIKSQKDKTIEEIETIEKDTIEPETKQENIKKLDEIAIMCITQLNYMCKEITDLIPRQNMEKMWNDWERICRGYGAKINPIYQRYWNQILKKAKKIKITEDTIISICEAQAKQMDLELKGVSSENEIKNISYTYYNWIRQVFEMCYLVQEPMSQEKTKSLYATYLTKLKNISNYKIEQIKSTP